MIAHVQLQGLIALRDEAAAGGAERIGVDADLLCRGAACGEIDVAACHHQFAVADQTATASFKRVGSDAQQAGAGVLNLATGIAERAGAQGQIAIAGDAAVIAIVQTTGNLQRSGLWPGRQQRAAAVIERVGLQG